MSTLEELFYRLKTLGEFLPACVQNQAPKEVLLAQFKETKTAAIAELDAIQKILEEMADE